MGWEAGQCKTSTPIRLFIVIPSLEGWPTKAKEEPSPHEVRLVPLEKLNKYRTILLLLFLVQ